MSEGTVAFVCSKHVDELAAAVPSDEVRLLPGHDQWVMGPGTKDAHVTPASLRDTITRKANPVIHGGVVSGTWTRRDRETHGLVGQSDRPAPDSSIEREVGRLSDVLGDELQLRITG